MRFARVAKRNLAHRGRSLLKKRTKAIGSVVPMVRYASLDWTDGGRRNTGHRHVGTTASALSSFCMPNFNQGLADLTELSKLDARTVSMSALCPDWDSPRADCNTQYKLYLQRSSVTGGSEIKKEGDVHTE